MVELTEEQRHELMTTDVPCVVDPATRERYVLVREELYRRMRTVLDDGSLDSAQVGRLVHQTMREYDEDDPLLDSYQKYRQ
jgi:hypothetical protein